MPRPELQTRRRDILYGLTAGGLLTLSGCVGDNGTDTAPDETGNTGDGQQPTNASGTEATADQSSAPSPDDGPVTADDDETAEADEPDEDEPTGETHTLTIALATAEGGALPEGSYIIIDGERTIDTAAGGDPAQVAVDLGPGEYTIRGTVRNEEYRWTTALETVRLYEDTTLNLTLSETPVVTVPVYAGTEGEWADNADITVTRNMDGATTTKTTDANGMVTFDLYLARYTFTGVDAHGNEQSKTQGILSENEVIRLRDLKPSDWTSTRTVTFIVNVAGEFLIEGMVVKGRNLSSEENPIDIETAPTDTDGRTSITAEQGDGYQVWVTDAEDGTYYDPVSVTGGGTLLDPDNAFSVDGETEIRIQLSDDAAPTGAKT